ITSKSPTVGVLCFEASGLMSKLIHLWQRSSEIGISRLRIESIHVEGVRKIVSNDDAFLLGLACAEMIESLRWIGESIAWISAKCQDPNLRSFRELFHQFADSGRDPHNWLLGSKEMESRIKTMNRLVAATAALQKRMDELLTLENGFRKLVQQQRRHDGDAQRRLIELQQRILREKQEAASLKEKSLWSRSFDTVASHLITSAFTIVARVKLVFGVGHVAPLSRSPSSSSALVYPSESDDSVIHEFSSSSPAIHFEDGEEEEEGIFRMNSRKLRPPESTLGAAGLSLHYANLIMLMEKMIRSPQLIGADARDALYSMLPNSIRTSLRARLKGVVGFPATDPVLATEWRNALHRILGWLSPLAHNMIEWHNERSFEHRKQLMPRTTDNDVLLLQTLCFANTHKTEAAITEMLVGLNYVWRFRKQMNA
ncbi:hypothetical protein M569_00874, partial [Genlisea aurea]